jgi:hypothetical protein
MQTAWGGYEVKLEPNTHTLQFFVRDIKPTGILFARTHKQNAIPPERFSL